MNGWVSILKNTIKGISSIGITFLTNVFVGNIVSTSSASKVSKACMAAGGTVLGFMLCDAACKYIDTEVDEIYDQCATMFGAGRRISEEFEEDGSDE